jgi:hypothetical protein
MLLSELLGVRVVTTDGDELGRVHDAVLVQDGPVGANGRAGLRLHALAVGRRSFGTKLGYVQGTVEGPWLLRRLLHRPPRLIPWPAIVHRDKQHIVVDPALAPEQV